MRTDKNGNPWFDHDVNSLAETTRTAYETYKAAYKAMIEARDAFESLMGGELPDVPKGKRYAFTYKYGKLSVGIVPDDKPAPKAKAPTQSLADFLRAQQASGRAA